MQSETLFSRLITLIAGSLLTIVVLLSLTTFRPYFNSSVHAAEPARFDYIEIVSSLFVYRGGQGVLVMDKRNGNIWFIPRGSDASQVVFQDPVLVTRLPFEKFDTVR